MTKKIILIGCLILLMFALGACSAETTSSNGDTQENEQNDITEPDNNQDTEEVGTDLPSFPQVD